MRTTVEGRYRNGTIELQEIPPHIPEGTPVLVTFLVPNGVELRAHDIDDATAAELRGRLATFADDRNHPAMDVYDDYDAAKTNL